MSDPNLYPRIDARRCSGCVRCVSICPTQALEMQQGTAVLAHPDFCTLCAACEEVCPDDAIALPFLIEFAASQSAPPGAPAAHTSPHP